MRTLVVVACFAFAAAAGCKKDKAEEKKPPPGEGPPPISKVEEKRGTEACSDFKVRACKCASQHPENQALATDCQLADSRIAALDLSIEHSTASNASAENRAIVIGNGRRVIQRCIERSAQLAKNCGLDGPPPINAPVNTPANAPAPADAPDKAGK